MENFNTGTYDMYKDISARTNGEIYIGVIGAVRTGKSSFIKRFMELMVLPFMEDENSRQRAVDEMPQAAQGKTIMTTEPKFIPKDAAKIRLGEDTEVKVRLIDCVGYMVEGATGHLENGVERMVKTPWFEEEIPFTKAAEVGTRKVINDHATIGIVVTADGSFTDIPRENYVKGEEETIKELQRIGKPFVMVLNSVKPYSEETAQLAKELEEKYEVSVFPLNCEQLRKEDVYAVLKGILYEFPVVKMNFFLPKWGRNVGNESSNQRKCGCKCWKNVVGSNTDKRFDGLQDGSGGRLHFQYDDAGGESGKWHSRYPAGYCRSVLL